MAVDARTKQVLWIKAGGVCSFPGCRKHLVRDATDTDREVLIGEMAHIVAQSPNGPRGDKPAPVSGIDSYENLMLMCHEHHEIIDQQPNTYPVEKLLQFKKEHEDWVKHQLSPEARFSGMETSPTLIEENVFCSLLPILNIPHNVYSGPCGLEEAQVKQEIIWPSDDRLMVPFIVRGGRLYTFNDLKAMDSPFAKIIDPYTADVHNAPAWWDNPDKRRWYVELLNRTLNKITGRKGLQLDREHNRYYFEPDTPGEDKSITYRSISGKSSTRSAAWNPKFKHNGQPKPHWEHLAASFKFHLVGDQNWVMAIRPERRFTKDGFITLEGKSVGRKATKKMARMYNLDVLKEVQFWRDFLAAGQPRIICRFGSQSLVINNELLTAPVKWPEVKNDPSNRLAVQYEDDLFSRADLDEIKEFEDLEEESFRDFGMDGEE